MKKIILFIFFVLFLAFIYWLLFPFIVSENNSTGEEISGLLRGYTPTFAALLTILFTTKRRGFKDYWHNIMRFKASIRSYLAVFLIPLFINVVVVIVTSQFIDSSISFIELNYPKFLAIYFIFIFLDGPLGEELGWRGFLLPEVLSKFSPLVSSLIIGLVMFFWHIIIFDADGPELNSSFIIKYLISILGISVIFTFFYMRFSKFPIIAVLLHTSINYFIFFRNSLIPEMKETPVDNITYVVTVVLVAMICLILLKNHNLKNN
ncbi:type II CAAX endopeptidase family protein [uncultured Croceitalea sp.]|uniref:CPBP family intramembrane glutamic endopeptidase n=1 Tax=uncultured Croceitalea sp. TaxID=1798908 RepID=UPI0033059669